VAVIPRSESKDRLKSNLESNTFKMEEEDYKKNLSFRLRA